MPYRELKKDRILREMCKIIVSRIETDPVPYIKEAIKWNREARNVHGNTSFIQEWDKVLHSSWNDIKKVMAGRSEHSKWLRQTCPFQGIITNDERYLCILKANGKKASSLNKFKERYHFA